MFINRSSLNFGKINVDNNSDLSLRFGLSGYPCYYFLNTTKDVYEEYIGIKDLSAIVNYLNMKLKINVIPKSLSYKNIYYSTYSSNIHEMSLSSFRSIISIKNKYLVILFYSYNSENYDKVNKIWNEISEIYESEIDIYFGKMDVNTNREITQQYGITSYPSIKIFRNIRDDEKNLEIHSFRKKNIDLQSLISFINENCNTNRDIKGKLIEGIGCNDEINKIIKESNKNIDKMIDKIHKYNDKEDVYIKILQKIKENGNNYLKNEIKRVKRILLGKNVKGKQRYKLEIKENILQCIEEWY